MAKKSMATRIAVPVATRAAPGLAAGFVRQALDRAVDGAGPLPGAAASADRQLAAHDGDVGKAIQAMIDSHVWLAGVQGFLTNLGGVVTMTVSIPANLTGLALLQCHLVAAIAHLRGYDLDDPRVRNAVMACLLGKSGVKAAVARRKIPTAPMGMATAPVHDPDLDNRIAGEVARELLGRVAGKKTIAMLARRTPVVGGGVGAVTDGYATYEIGKYATKQLKRRRR